MATSIFGLLNPPTGSCISGILRIVGKIVKLYPCQREPFATPVIIEGADLDLDRSAFMV